MKFPPSVAHAQMRYRSGVRLVRHIAAWTLSAALVACSHPKATIEPKRPCCEVDETASAQPRNAGDEGIATTREEIERELSTPSDSGGGAINFPGAELVANRGEPAMPTVIEIVRDHRGACAAAIRGRRAEDGRRCFIRLAALDALSMLCRKATAERIVPVLVALARDAGEHDKERSFAIAALAFAGAPSA